MGQGEGGLVPEAERSEDLQGSLVYDRNRLDCPDDVSVAAWLDGSVEGDRRTEIEHHLDTCESCRNLFADVVRATRGATTLGRFVLAEPLGAGAMGEVHAATDPKLGRRVALKLPRGAGEAGESRVQRLLREAQMMAQLSHPNVVAVHEVGSIASPGFAGARSTPEGSAESVTEVPYIVMEHVDGTDLAAWRSAETRSTDEIVRVVAEVARGLAAVHKAGLVHRDVKPSNILIDRDGRARLGDFGLAGSEAQGSGGTATDEVQITQTGEIVGTPAYMAPEQLRGERATPASDQFALCVVLYELLCGQRPFAGATLAELTKHVLAGELREPAVRLPAHVLRALRRGLATDPDARFPSVSALADALEPRATARRWVAATIAAVALSAAAIAVVAWPRAGSDPCAGGAAELAPAWNPGRRAALVGAFGASGKAYAPAAAARVVDTLDAYAAAWIGGHRAACVANRVRHVESDTRFDQRQTCLAERRRRLDALATALSAPNASAIEHATTAALALPAVEDCADEHGLADADPDPVRHAALEDRAAAIVTQIELGDYATAAAAVGPLSDDVGKLDAPGLATRVLGIAAMAKLRSGDAKGAEASFRAALDQAARAHADGETARLWGALIHVIGVAEHRPAEALAMVDAAKLALVRAGGKPELEAGLDTNVGPVQRMAGKIGDARATLERAVALDEQLHGKDSPDSVTALGNYAAVLSSQGHYDEALAIEQRLVAIQTRAHGPDHPLTAHARANYAALLDQTGDHAHSAEEVRAAIAILSAASGPDNEQVLQLWNNLGISLSHLGKLDEARAAFGHALAAEKREPMIAADALNGLARFDRAHAIELLRHSLALREASEGPDHPDVGITLVNLGDALRDEHACAEAAPMFERAAKLLRALRRDHPFVGHALAGQGLCLVELGKRADARAPLTEARQIAVASHDQELVTELDRALQAR